MALYSCYFISMLLFFSSMQVWCSAHGRPLLKLAEPVKGAEGDRKMMVSSMLGSRPPICARRCIACGHCEAIQVPVDPPKMRHFSNTMYSRGEVYNSNYKPMNWKCKCGNKILNP